MRFNLKNLRESNKLTQDEMAKILKTSRPNYSKIENGHAEPTIEMAYILRNKFDIDDVLECLKVFEMKNTTMHQ